MEKDKKEYILNFWFPLILAILIYCIGDVLLKIGNAELGFQLSGIFEEEFWVALIASLPIVSSFILAMTSKLIMGLVLSKNPLGITEGIFLALTAVITFFLGILIFGENLMSIDLVAISLIAIGILLVYNFDIQKEEIEITEVDESI